FVAVEKRTGDRLASGMPETRVVPVSAPAGWAMATPKPDVASTYAGAAVRSLVGSAAPPPVAAQGMRARMSMARPAPAPMMAAPPPFAAPMAPSPAASRKAAPGGPPRAEASASPGDPVAELFARQLVSGLWRDGDESPRALLDA